MITKRLFLDLTPSEWHSLVAKVSQLGTWTPKSNSQLTTDLFEDRLAAIGKNNNTMIIMAVLEPAVEVLEDYLPSLEEVSCEKNTFDGLQRQLKEEINLRLEIQAEMEKQKEKYEANMKKMMMLVDKLNAALKAKEEQCLVLETVKG